MKRLAWLLAAVFCTFVVQEQPAVAAKAGTCDCCHHHAAGMPDCCPTVPAVPLVLSAEQPTAKIGAPFVRRVQAVRPAAVKFYALFVEPAAVRSALRASAAAAPATAVPLFKAHCSFLI